MPVLHFNTSRAGYLLTADNGLTKTGTVVELGGTLVQNTDVEADGFTLTLTQTDAAIGVAKGILTNTAPLLRAGWLVENINDAGFYAGATSSAGLDALRTQIEVVDGGGVSTGFYAQMINQVYTTGLRMDNTAGGTTMNFENHNNDSFFLYDCDTDTTTLGTLAGDTVISGIVSFPNYPSNADDTGTYAPISFFYPGAAGELYVAPLSALSSTSWSLTGNAGTNDATDFLGTTDDVNVVFRRNNLQAGYIGKYDNNEATFFGDRAGLNNTSQGVTAFGAWAAKDLPANSDGVTAIGYGAGATVLGVLNVEYSTYVGEGCGADNQGAESTMVGQQSGAGNTGPYSTFLGRSAGQNNTGDYATFLGHGAGPANGFDNVIGLGASATPLADNEFAIGTQTRLNFALNSTGAETGYVLTNTDGNGIADWRPQACSSGIDTPTLTDTANISASAVNSDTTFIMVTDPASGEVIVTAQFSVLVTPTVTATLTELRVTLPVAANPSADNAGQGSYFDNGAPVAAIVTPVDANTVSCRFTPIDTGSNVLNFSITYRAN